MSTSLEKFKKVISRCTNLTSLYEALEETRKTKALPVTPEETIDLVRAAIVLAVSGMDMYFTDRFVAMLVPYLKKKGPNKGLASLLERAGVNTEAALELIRMDRPYRRIRALVSLYLVKYSAQQINRIDELFAGYGLPQLSTHAARITKKKMTLARIKALVDRRNDIAHNADLDSRGNLKPMFASRVIAQLKNLFEFVLACDQITENVCKKGSP